MSVPSPYCQRTTNGSAEPREDCRDYLRTGRCKYGASCKYNHPPNVQSGGGMKAPLDPTEPMFPIRPKEPVCQYYMKHGTCKFGQACKFHHPPQSTATATLVAGTGGAVVMNVGRKNDTSIVLNTVADSTGSPMMLQFLPQRPDEPDCIFFLKNGRCKYGASCRYHHPVNFHQRRQDEIRRQRGQQVHDGMLPSKLQFVGQPVQHTKYQQTPSSSGTHVVASDGSVAVMSFDGNAAAHGSYQPISISMSSEGAASYCAPVGLPLSVNQEQASSSSSIASSYDTASSNVQLDATHSVADGSSGLWNRSKSVHSSLNVNAYATAADSTTSVGSQRTPQVASLGTRLVLAQSSSEGSISSRRRAASYGSASDTVYVDAGAGAGAGAGARPTQTTLSSGSTSNPATSRAWRSDRSPNNYENSRRGQSNQYVSSGSDSHGESGRSSVVRSARPKNRGQHHSEAVDDGFVMMTSALLNMLDTPEEAPAQTLQHENGSGTILTEGQYAVVHDKRQDNNLMSRSGGASDHQDLSNTALYPLHRGSSGNHLDQGMFGGMMAMNPRETSLDSSFQDPAQIAANSVEWLPTWQGFHHHNVGRPLEGNAQSMSVIQPRHAASNSPHTAASNVGLFLP